LLNEPTLKGLAHQIAANETRVLRIIKNFVGWIKRNINYTTHEVPFYPNETLMARKGDCDDQAILLITLARIMGIPSYLQIGAIYMPEQGVVNETYWDNHVRAVQEMIGWHGWAMVNVPPWGWLPVDLTYVLADLSSDSLNAIRYGAVVWQKTIQYMNFSRVDYVATSRQARSFIIENGFFVDVKDEMTETQQNNSVGSLEPMVALTFSIAMIMLVVSSLLIARRWRKHPEISEVHAPLKSRP
jgi:transglutaminase-like putative cysteine protease